MRFITLGVKDKDEFDLSVKGIIKLSEEKQELLFDDDAKVSFVIIKNKFKRSIASKEHK